MLPTCFSTALSVTTKARAIAGLLRLRPSGPDFPLAGVNRSSGSRRHDRASSWDTTSGSRAALFAHPTCSVDELGDIGHRL